MTEKEILEIVTKLKNIAYTNHSGFLRSTVSYNINNFEIFWLVENSFNPVYTASIKIDSFETAVDIIYRFSSDKKENIRLGLLQNKSFNTEEELFLQFIKDIKY